jgi:TolB-like protein
MRNTLLITVFLLFGTFAFSQEKIAVFPFEDPDNLLNRTETILFYRDFSNEFATKTAGKLIVVPRLRVEELIDMEANFQMSRYSERAKTAEWEKVLNGTQILSGVIGKVGSNIRITVSLYTYPDLRQLPGTSRSVTNKDQLFAVIPEIVQSMMSAITEGNRNTPGRTYKIGDTGPAGGIVFYDRGFIGDGWRYLEAAPAGTDFTAIWGASGYRIATSITLGSGKNNTHLIVEQLKTLGENNRAALICAGIDINGYKDWFLPSIGELDLLYKNLKQKGLGGFSDGWYWSSSQHNEQYSLNRFVWAKRFSDGFQEGGHKNGPASVRAIRAF